MIHNIMVQVIYKRLILPRIVILLIVSAGVWPAIGADLPSDCNKIIQAAIIEKPTGEQQDMQLNGVADTDALSLTVDQIKRLTEVFAQLNKSDLAKIFQALSNPEIFDKLKKIRGGDIDAKDEQLFIQYPLLQTVLADLVELGLTFPTIFNTAHADSVVPQLLTALLKQTENKPRTQQADLEFAGFHKATTFSRTLNRAIKNLIQSAIQEHQGITYGRPFTQRVREGFSRYFSPLYKRVKQVVEFTQGKVHSNPHLKTVRANPVNPGVCI